MNAAFLDQHPEIIAILIVLLGFAAASLVAAWLGRGLEIIERGMRRVSPQRAQQFASRLPRKALQRVVYYLTLAFFLLLAIRLLGITALTDSLDAVLAYLPQVLLGGIIIVIGYLLGLLTHAVVASRLRPGHPSILPRVAQGVVVVTAVMTGLEQMSVDLSFMTTVLVILLAVTLGGLSLAFALGSRDLVANLLARRNLAGYRIGDVVRIGDAEGAIVEFTRVAVVLETSEGTVRVPASHFLVSEVTLLNR
jgi:small-conductance mechanosensitive channel